jgi:uncharacterized membrane protein
LTAVLPDRYDLNMTRYDILLFLHISAAIIWIGSGFPLNILAARADRRRDDEGIRRVLADVAGLANVLFIPAAFAALVFGILLVLDGPWSFDQLWIILGLAGFAATFVTGLFVLKPRSEHVAAIMERDGGMSEEALVGARQLMIIGRSDYVVLFLVVADMVLKPTKDDVGTLAVMGAILVAGIGYVVVKARSAGVRERTA